jgi:hypothetical protein
LQQTYSIRITQIRKLKEYNMYRWKIPRNVTWELISLHTFLIEKGCFKIRNSYMKLTEAANDSYSYQQHIKG